MGKLITYKIELGSRVDSMSYDVPVDLREIPIILFLTFPTMYEAS